MIILARFTNVSEANYTKELLENNNIPCILKKDYDSEEVDRVDLVLTHDSDFQSAQEIIENDEKNDAPL